jgi:hypothetical protein
MTLKFSGRLLAGLAMIASAAAPAMADETWTTAFGTLIYERDVNNYTAVISYPIPGTDMRGEAFIEGMTGYYPREGSLEGIWIEPATEEGPFCGVSLAHPETGKPVGNWGRARVIFTDPTVPNGMVIQRGFCFEDPYWSEMAVSNLGTE